MKDSAVEPGKFLKQIRKKTLFLGEGAFLYHNLIKKILPQKAIIASCKINFTNASCIALLGMEKLKEGFTENPDSLTPYYLKKSEAEIQHKKKQQH